MSTTETENIKVIYNITLDKPYVNRTDGIISKITFKPKHGEVMEHERKTYYQPGEKKIFKAAGIHIDEIVLPRISEARTITVNDIVLDKISDGQFEFNISTDVTVEEGLDYEIEKNRIVNESERVFVLVRRGLKLSPEQYSIKTFRRTVCNSSSCVIDDEPTKQTRLGRQ